MNELQKEKRRLRGTKAWKTLRHNKNVEQKGIDPITRKKLTKTANLHHMLLDPTEYSNLSNEVNFVMLNKMSHDVLHFCYNYQSKDSGFMERLSYWVNKMLELNKK